MPRFTTRDLLWAALVVALLASHVSTRLAVQKARIEQNLWWNQLARDAGVIRQMQREQIRQAFAK